MATVLRNIENNRIKVIYFTKPKYIRKICFNKNYFKYLKNEIQGLNWYGKVNKKKTDIIKFKKKNDIFYLDIKFFKGEKNIFYDSIKKNELILTKAINHYADKWPKQKKVRCHGDLTIDNIIINKNKVKFIDWELSSPSSEVWGHDIIYLLISSIFFSYDIKKRIDDDEKIVFVKLWSKLKRFKISKTILSDPISYFKKIYNKKEWQEVIKDHPNKIYPIFIKKEFKKLIKGLIK